MVRVKMPDIIGKHIPVSEIWGRFLSALIISEVFAAVDIDAGLLKKVFGDVIILDRNYVG